jgi:hypothetical protein
MIRKPVYYATPALLAVLLFTSNFLSTDIFKAGYQNFSVWFVLSIFAFACGWLIDKTLGWTHGGKVVFSVIVASSFFSILLVSIFSGYFGLSDLLTETLILYTLRNIMLGSFAFFGMAIVELLRLQKEVSSEREKSSNYERLINDAKKEAKLTLDEAKLKANQIIFDAQKGVDELTERKSRIERQLREFINSEKELIKQYDKED